MLIVLHGFLPMCPVKTLQGVFGCSDGTQDVDSLAGKKGRVQKPQIGSLASLDLFDRLVDVVGLSSVTPLRLRRSKSYLVFINLA